MLFTQIATKFGFRQIEKNSNKYLEIETDFEVILINQEDETKYFDGATNLLRFLDEELFEDYPCTECIDGVYFLPTHKLDKLWESLENQKKEQDLEGFYTDEMLESFSESEYISGRALTIVEHSNRSKVGTSLYRVEIEAELSSEEEVEKLITAGNKILELNAMKNFLIAYGSIPSDVGLLEKSLKVKTTNPSSRHYNFWKYSESKASVKFTEIAENFILAQRGRL